MAKVIGFDPKLMKQCTCRNCAAIIEYSLTEVKKHANIYKKPYPLSDGSSIKEHLKFNRGS